MRKIIVLVCTIWFISSTAQSIECKLLDSAIHHDLFEKQFRVSIKDTTYTIYNQLKAKLECNTFELGNSTFQISNDTAYNKVLLKRSSRENYKRLIVLSTFEKKGSYYRLFFWKTASNSTLELKYKVKRGKIKLVDKSWGSF
jgi:hypothetical protein